MQTFEQKKIGELTKVREIVRSILEDFPETRNNDSLLTVVYLEFMGVNGWGKLMDAAAKQSICFESIRRARQVIQASGKYLPTDETVIKRRRLQAVYEQMSREGTRG